MNKYDELVNNILSSANDSMEGALQRSVILDMQNETHFQCVMELFGGEEHVRSEFPQLYERAVNARQAEPVDEIENGFVDREVICDLSATTDQSIYSFGLTSLREDAEEIYSIMTLYYNGNLVKRNFSFAFDCHRHELDCLSDPIPGLHGDIRAELHVTWTPKGSNILHSALMDSRQAYESVEDPVESASLEHPSPGNYITLTPVPLNEPNPPEVVVRPSKRGSIQHSYINVCYDRAPENGESINYAYGSTRIGNMQQRIFLDVRGRFSLQEKCTFRKINSIGMGLDLGSGGSAVYRSLIDQSKNITVDQQKREVSFAFPTDWKAEIPSRKMAGREMSYLDLKIAFTYLDERSTDPSEHKERIAQITASSAISHNPSLEQTSHYIQLAKIKLNWGCVEANTLVRMADGDERKICNVRAGDYIYSPDQGAVLVTNFYSGIEPELFAVRAVGGQTLLLTADHPVCTGAGMKAAMNLTPEDKLVLEDGTRADIDALYLIQGDFRVYSLELQKSGVVICNGYQTGDLDIQGELMCGAPSVGTPNAERLAEAEKLARFFK